MPTSFADFDLPAPLLDALEANGIASPFPIQVAAIPPILSGRDVSGRAPTGSGKTIAFGLPILARVETADPMRPRALILTPTRELAAQIRRDLAPYGKASRRQVFAVYGGVRYAAQIDRLRKGVDVLVATPGRLEDLIDQDAVSLANVSIVAVDEADRMADLGFLPAVRRIIDQTSDDRQALLFSATLDGEVEALVRRYQRDPVTVESGSVDSDARDAEHIFWSIEHPEKVERTAQVVGATGNAIVFARTRHGVDRLARQMGRHGVRAAALHGGLSQNRRNRALAEFKRGDVDALVATDVAARGIHVDGVASVVHFDPPNGHKDYLHRSGRTARAGSTGVVVSLVTKGERRASLRMQRNLGIDVPIGAPDVDRLGSGEQARQRAPQGRRAPSAAARVSPPPKRPERRKATTGTTPGPSEGSGATDLVVSNLPWSTTDQDLRRLFAKHGAVHSAAIKIDRRGRSKGTGIVRMRGRDAAKAMGALDGRRVGGRPITVRRGTLTR